MNFLAIDTSGKYLTVIAFRDGTCEKRHVPDCALKHSVVLMDEIDETLSRVQMSVRDCDFFAVVVGPGSFTGIRIGISTVKGLCFACGKPALAVTSFDCIAYADKSAVIALSDAGRGEFYACGYNAEHEIVLSPCILPASECTGTELAPAAVQPLFEGCGAADPAEGLLQAVLAKADDVDEPSKLTALYLRKSSAEENRR